MSVLVFDLDGTLVSSMSDLTATLNAVLVDNGHRAVAPESVRAQVGQGAKALLQQGLEANGVAWTDDEITPLFGQFLTYYEAHIADHTRPFPGAIDAMIQLREAGWRLAVCTNKIERLTHALLDALDMTRHFDAIVARDTFANAKPHAEPVLGAISRAGGVRQRSVMIGDTATDIDAARAAGIPVVAVDFGYTQVPVSDLGPDRIISHFNELPQAILDLRLSS
ncbi:HAD-IA family hydrolase [Roseibium polysiphoniae]|uniref:HAD-IA family hydrolase n=1 Tax=Roseibium polysiphoniae TaxID=2571221 RepID=UPI003299FA86